MLQKKICCFLFQLLSPVQACVYYIKQLFVYLLGVDFSQMFSLKVLRAFDEKSSTFAFVMFSQLCLPKQ